MSITSSNCKAILFSQGCNPDIVFGDWATLYTQSVFDKGIPFSCLYVTWQYDICLCK